MEQLEIHPINTRVVCLNQPHLKPLWIFKALSSTLGYYYNNHQLQVVWAQAAISLPTQKTFKVRGHASHAVCAETPVLNTNIQTGTYLMFHLPRRLGHQLHSCKLILNGVEAAVRTTNPSKIRLQLIRQTEDDISIKASIEKSQLISRLEDTSLDNKNVSRQQRVQEANNYNNYKSGDDPVLPMNNCDQTGCHDNLEIDFAHLEKVVTLMEEEEDMNSSDESDCSDDLHKVVRSRLVADIGSLLQKWKEESTDDILVLLLKPAQQNQAWQFSTAWISVTLQRDKTEPVSLLPGIKKTNLTRKKPVSSSDSFFTLNMRRKQQLTDIQEDLKDQLEPCLEREFEAF